MALQFNRDYEIRVFSEGTTPSLRIRELEITFSITKNLYGYPNTMKLDIFNLSESSLGVLQKSYPKTQRVYQKIQVYIGYDGEKKLAFSGDISNIWLRREGVDRITEVYAKDGINSFDSDWYSKTFQSGTSFRQIFQDIAGSMRDVIKTDLRNFQDKKSLSPISLSGSVATVSQKLASMAEAEFSLQDGVATVVDKNAKPQIFPNSAVLINQETGMIGSPTLTYTGVEVKTLLNPAVNPGGIIRVQSQAPEINTGNLTFFPVLRQLGAGYFFVQKIQHSGDFRGNTWESVITGRSME